MADFRKQRFAGRERFAFLGPDGEPPDSGWAVSPDGRVFCDGKLVGTQCTWQLGAPGDRAYKEIEYVPVEDEPGGAS